MTDFAYWLLDLVKKLLGYIIDIAKDVFIAIVKLVLDLFGELIAAIPAPDFATGGFSTVLQAIDPAVWYFAGRLNLSACFGVLASAFAFRMARKIVTLFQW